MSIFSIVFKLYGNEESLLFCGDIQHRALGRFLLENYKDKLKSDYLQVPHHGNNYMGIQFYKAVSPKIALFSAPDWLIYNFYDVPWYKVFRGNIYIHGSGAFYDFYSGYQYILEVFIYIII